MRQRRLGSSRYQDREYAILAVLTIPLGFVIWNYSNTIFGLLSSSPLLQSNRRKKSSSFSIYRNSSLHVNVCGQHMNMDNSSFGLDENIDCSGVPWPKQGVRPAVDQQRLNSDHKLCPWPAALEDTNYIINNGAPFVNFTPSLARSLLSGRTVFINGDSTSRRLMWSLCNFLDDTTNASSPHKRSGEGCCGTHRVDIHCNLPSVLEADIMIEYNPPLLWDDTIAWLESSCGLTKALTLRNHSSLEGMKNMNNSIPPEQMPRSKQAKSIHIFHPVAASWHQCLGVNWTETTTCGLNREVGTNENDVHGTVCRIVSDFCPRFANASLLEKNSCSFLNGITNETQPPLHMHGLTNVLASPGVSRFNPFNSFMLNVAHATSSGSTNMCNANATTTSQTTEANQRKYNHEKGISCGFHDQTTFMSANTTSKSVRTDCMPSEGWNGIHIYNEYGQLMRVQLLLNSILRAEEGWEVASERKQQQAT